MKNLIISISIYLLTCQILSAQWQKVDMGLDVSNAFNQVLKLDDRVIAGTDKRLYSKLDSDTLWRPVEGTEYAGKGLWKIINTQNDKIAAFSNNSTPIFISLDKGLNWHQKDLPANAIPLVMAFDADTLLGLAQSNGSNPNRIFSTPDWGVTWKQYKYPSIPYSFSQIAKIGNYLFLGRPPIPDHPYDTTLVGVVRTSDGGENWETVKIGLNPKVTFLRAKDTVLYAGTESGLYISKNYGNSWEQVGGLFGSYAQFFDYEGNTLVAYIDNRVFLSTDNGANWTIIADEIHTELSHSNTRPNGITIRKGTVYISTRRGIYSTNDIGLTWKVEGFEGANPIVYTLTTIDSKLYAGTNNNGLLRSDNNGETWSRIDSNFFEDVAVTPSVNFITAGEDVIYANKYTGNNIYVTDRNTLNWRNIKTNFGGGYILGLTEYKGVLIVRHLSGFYYSSDKGENWTRHDSIPGGSQFVHYGDTLLAPTSRNGVWYTVDGSIWNRYRPRIQSSGSISLYNKQGSYEVITASEVVAGSTIDYSLLSRDGGITWDSLDHSVSNIYFNGSQILAAFDSVGIRYSSDSGKTWTLKNQGIDPLDLTNSYPYNGYKFTIIGDTIFIYGGTAIYKDALRNYITSVEEQPDITTNEFTISPPYPMPSGDKIHVQIQSGQEIDLLANSIEIFTVLGEKVSTVQDITIVNRTTNSALVTWNCQSMQAGVYVMKVKQGSVQKAIPIIVTR